MAQRILFIEDEGLTVRRLAETLDALDGYTVELIGELAEAVDRLAQNEYDLLILDIMLPHTEIVGPDVPPKKTGIGFARMLRRGVVGDQDLTKNAAIPLIVLTAVVDVGSIREINDLKPHALLRKPVTWKEFYGAICSVFPY